ncbi:MAG: biopolymer transporter ExbD [Acidobacteria bacterium]|nr:MAG: biopolymer transporter ExbD [Acidobacteriota bacterium]
MSFALGRSGKPAAEMNVTPLIDVLLVLLIIFMIITPMDPHGLYTAVPQEHGKSAPNETPIVLQLKQAKSGTPLLSINRQEVVSEELQSRLLEIYKSRHDGVLFIKGDADVDFEYVAEAIDTAHNANVQRVGLIP